MFSKITYIIVSCFLSKLVFAQNIPHKPSPLQMAQSERGYGMFIHFGLNTFNEVEWSEGMTGAAFKATDNIPVEKNKGWLLIVKDSNINK
jgi:alpha-L-fucosidase